MRSELIGIELDHVLKIRRVDARVNAPPSSLIPAYVHPGPRTAVPAQELGDEPPSEGGSETGGGRPVVGQHRAALVDTQPHRVASQHAAISRNTRRLGFRRRWVARRTQDPDGRGR